MLHADLINFISKLMQVANYVRFCLNHGCHEVNEGFLLTTKMIQVNPYTICS